MSSQLHLGFGLLFAFRIWNALLLQTSYTPDEFFQSAEVAHWWTFGFGFLSWEWEPCVALRSAFHPSLFKILYHTIDHYNLRIAVFAVSPRVFQAFFAAACDYAVSRFTSAWYGGRTNQWAYTLCMLSWYSFFGMCRPYSNCMEACWTSLALWMWTIFKRSLNFRFAWASILFAGLAVVVRPTAAVFLTVFLLLESLVLVTSFSTAPSSSRRRCDHLRCLQRVATYSLLFAIFVSSSAAVIIPFLLGFLVDRSFYGRGVFPPLNFARFNGASAGVNRIYGTQPTLFYLIVGLPVVLLSFLPLFCVEVGRLIRSFWTSCISLGKDHGDRSDSGPLSALAGVFAVVVMLSGVPHKEERFLMQLHPIMLGITSNGLSRFMSTSTREKARPCRGAAHKLCLVALFLPQILVGGFMSRFHLKGAGQLVDLLQRTAMVDAPTTNAEYLQSYFQGDPATLDDAQGRCLPSVFFLTPCHHVPLYSHFHSLVPVGFWDCSPDIQSMRNGERLQSWRQKFQRDPVGVLEDVFGNSPPPGQAPLYPLAADGVPLVAHSDVYIHPFDQWRHTRKAAWFGGLTPEDYDPGSAAEDAEEIESPSALVDVERCLAYRFQLALKASQLPSHFVVSSVVLPSVSAWLGARGYAERSPESPILDSVLAESFDGLEWWSKFHVLEHRCRNN